ncbi:MAG: protein kinase [Gemmatimonadaceae bacterium]
MTTPVDAVNAERQRKPMTPERWRAVDAVLKAALGCEPSARDAFVAEACADDEGLHHEVMSLLAAHDRASDDFLEQPAVASLATSGVADESVPLATRLANALTGRYVIEREVAHGGMATVYLARDLRHDRPVAIKVLRQELAAAVGGDRFLQEIRVTASLQHPHILPLFDSGNADGLLWYAMPYVEGETLRTRLSREGRLPVADAVRIARELADGLEYAHRRGVVHRDVKPENVLLQGNHAVLGDFGISLALEQAGGDRLTRTGLTIGTPQYMAPEQASGGGTVDARADVYALGVVLHEMIAGESPFAAASPHAVLRRVLADPPTALAARRSDVASFLDSAVQRALAKAPDDRFASAAEFSAALDAPLNNAAVATPVAPTTRRKVSARAAMYATAAMLVVGIAVGWLVGQWRLPRVADIVPSVNVPAIDLTGNSRSGGSNDLELSVVDRSGRLVRAIPANRPWTPRFSPDGRRVAFGAFGEGRSTSDVWVTDIESGTTRRVTDDETDGNDPQWSADGASVAYSASAQDGKDILVRRIGAADAKVVAARPGTQFPSDWRRDGNALLVTDEVGGNKRDIVIQPMDGSAAQPYVATPADETGARVSPDGRWVAYTSDEAGQPEVYISSYAQPRRRVLVSRGGGEHAVWRGDGRELYYWRNGVLLAVKLSGGADAIVPTVDGETELFRAPYFFGPNVMYDVTADGEKFVIVQQGKGR